jgi:hypothetical protein
MQTYGWIVYMSGKDEKECPVNVYMKPYCENGSNL